MNQYELVMNALVEMAASESDTADKAQGLYIRFLQGNVVLGLLCALDTTKGLEALNVSLQSRTQTADELLSAVACLNKLCQKQNPESFQTIYTKETKICETLHLTSITSPHT